MRTSADLARAAALAGARLVEVRAERLRDGSTALAGRFAFEDPWAAAKLLGILSEEDASDPAVQAWGRSIAATVRSRDELAAAIHANVQHHVRFEEEQGERFQSARATMIEGVGDCDCHARLVHALARSQGIGSTLRFFERGGEPSHVVAALETSRGPAWAETTIGARFGENPLDAFQRLGLTEQTRPDLGCCAGPARIGAFDWSHPWPRIVVPSTVDTKKSELDAIVSSLDRDVAACTKLDGATASAWRAFVAGWRAFRDAPSSWLDAAAEMDQAEAYETEIASWQAKLSALCVTSAPPIAPRQPATGLGTVLLVGGGFAAAIALARAAEAWAPKHA